LDEVKPLKNVNLSLNYEPINLAHDIELPIGANEKKMVILCWLLITIGPCDNILLAPQFGLLKIVECFMFMGGDGK
jgi:hypothetical protein